MPDISLLAVLVGAIAGFMIGGAYYAVLGVQLADVSDAGADDAQPPWTLVVEFLRCLILAAVIAGLASEASVESVGGGLVLGLALWVGFPLVLWTGAVVHEKTPIKKAAIHAGDWLVKLPVIGVIVSVWQ